MELAEDEDWADQAGRFLQTRAPPRVIRFGVLEIATVRNPAAAAAQSPPAGPSHNAAALPTFLQSTFKTPWRCDCLGGEDLRAVTFLSVKRR